jgi:hypothetical protein
MGKIAAVGVLVCALALVTAGIALSAHGDGEPGPGVTISDLSGNPPCDGATKIEGDGDVESGTYTVYFEDANGGLWPDDVRVEVTKTSKGPVFSFEVLNFPDAHLVTSIVVKGGKNALLYQYAGSGVAHDDGLHSPLNTKNGKWFGLSHLCFAGDKL